MNAAGSQTSQPDDLHPAGFWQRAAAWSIDAALVAPVAALLAWPWLSTAAYRCLVQFQGLLQQTGRATGAAVIDGVPLPLLATALMQDPALRAASATSASALWSMVVPALLAFALLGAIYHVACECSAWQGGLGKRILRLRACERSGGRLGLVHASGRYLSGTLSWATFNLGHLMAAVPPAHLALHDRASHTRVVAHGSQTRLPAWAWAWLGLLAVAGLGATAWLSQWAAAIMQTTLEQFLEQALA